MWKRLCEAEHQNTRESVARRGFRSIKSRSDDEFDQICFPASYLHWSSMRVMS